MILICPACQTQYRLDSTLLGLTGRTVGCASCKHQWFQSAPDFPAPPPADEIVLADPSSSTFADADPLNSAAAAHFETDPSGAVNIPIPEGLLPPLEPKTVPPVYTPINMSPAAFGFLIFLLLTFLTLIGLFLARDTVVKIYPPLHRFYQTLGIHIPVPGEGLRLGQLTAENRIDQSFHVIVLDAQLTNLTDHPLPAPALQVDLRNSYGRSLKTWTLKSRNQPPLAPGATAPLKLDLKDAPDEGAEVTLRIVEP